MDRIFTAILLSFVIGIVVSPLVIFFARKLKAKQNIYEYVDMHKGKQGTPTMGGIGIIISLTIASLICTGVNNHLALITIVVMVAFGVLGFLDDFLKIHFKHNEGLKPYQKIIGQVAIAVIVSIFSYTNELVGPSILLPFSTTTINLGWWFIPFCLFVFIATTNAVNLTDGLDGLAGGVSLSYLVGFVFILFIVNNGLASSLSTEIQAENLNLMIVGGAGIGALLAYLIFNCFPAKIFMGDTGSLALGGLISCLAIFSKEPLLILILGICFVMSAVSVILQVAYYKLTKKRIFLMAPLHHHFEKKGVHENRIVVIYIVITTILSVGGILLTMFTI
ncbi:MAG: phospho-N-acetylmuramoyl-pentapeptide-transferase [Clostridiales bacterium]|nr:phospho-N-acetylmuramoyl-pentapeptide-transferase [Candidatus Apopatousia equi]